MKMQNQTKHRNRRKKEKKLPSLKITTAATKMNNKNRKEK